ncbi:MAG: dihydroorotate dehydrogenase electron transfer subunit [Thermodesulfobacteriota bacterium]
MILQQDTRILWNRAIGSSYFHMGLRCGEGFENAVPGQFVTLRIPDQQTPLLRRPFSIHRLVRENDSIRGIEILYRVVGNCTGRLSRLSAGDRVSLLGPLGNGFSVPGDGPIYMAAGGIGVAPMVFLAESIHKKSPESSPHTLFLGGRTQTDLLCMDIFRSLGMALEVSTDDGSVGYEGLVTDLLQQAVLDNPPERIVACGPMPMLKTVARIARSRQVPCEVSIETLMACGMGVCLGCAVEDRRPADKYRHVCIDGPVFEAATLLMDS